jgi:hypothetical protein
MFLRSVYHLCYLPSILLLNMRSSKAECPDSDLFGLWKAEKACPP